MNHGQSETEALGERARPVRLSLPTRLATAPTRFWIGWLSAVIFGWVTLDVLLTGPLVTFDHIVENWVVHQIPQDIILTMRQWVVLPGQRLYNVPPLGVLSVLVAWRYRQWRPMAVPLVVMVFLAVVVPAMKIWTGRTNPLSGGDHLWAGGLEYPSGHEINAIIVWGMTFLLASLLPWPVGRWLTARRRALLTALMGVIVGGAVVIARTHWLSDVIASIFFSIPLLWGIQWYGMVRHRHAEGGPP